MAGISDFMAQVRRHDGWKEATHTADPLTGEYQVTNGRAAFRVDEREIESTPVAILAADKVANAAEELDESEREPTVEECREAFNRWVQNMLEANAEIKPLEGYPKPAEVPEGWEPFPTTRHNLVAWLEPDRATCLMTDGRVALHDDDVKYQLLTDQELAQAGQATYELNNRPWQWCTEGGWIRADSGLTPAEHEYRYGSLETLPDDHPEKVGNRNAYHHGRKAAEADAGNNFTTPTPNPFIDQDGKSQDIRAHFWLSGYQDQKFGHPAVVPTRLDMLKQGKLAQHAANIPREQKAILFAALTAELIALCGDDEAFTQAMAKLDEARSLAPTETE